MSDSHHAGGAVNPYDLFSAKEWEGFNQSDTQAARTIVILLVSIFVIGIGLYSIVAATL